MRGPSTGIVYGGLKYQARCITDVKADVDHTSFLAGTLSLKEENEVHLIRLSPSGSELICDGLFYHPNEIWDLKSCPFDPRIFSTVFTSGETYGASVWKIPELYGQSNAPQPEQLFSLDEHSFKIKSNMLVSVLWWPSGKHDRLISIDEGNIFLWSLDSSNKVAKVISQESVGMLQNLSGGAWDPHDRNALSGICDSSLQFWDLRTMKKTTSIEQAHIRDVDYNSKKQHFLVTAEDVSGIQLWDLRRPKFPVKELPGHAHWTWAVRHNPEYEDLILSAGTDSTINLWSIRLPGNEGSSSESLFDSPTTLKDSLINSYTDYEDSVYGLAWSTREPLIFASLSYDGRVIVESVKSFIKRK
ncbi:WD repeat-containing protein DWA2-like isoform X1 [Zingiber officinale]|uniref:WD repeat-containing protein DWA2-like isoform X1 n=1 Tax=Zingiber officinale TaxID=94328 RepID=UPI001C4DC0AB|nr:WD repeat-containing protein DWA2-like isoform X1 [Zingiber officinale]